MGLECNVPKDWVILQVLRAMALDVCEVLVLEIPEGLEVGGGVAFVPESVLKEFGESA